jgi:hypothetical protein
MLTIGKHMATIREHRVSEMAGKEVVRISCVTEDGDDTQVLVWLTEKSMGIARHQLRLCGLDIDKDGLEILNENSYLLSGHAVPILVEEWKGQMRAQIMLNSEPSKKRMAELTTQLRACKRDEELPVPSAAVRAETQATVDDFDPNEELPF